jgi:hypothetical protein
LPGKLAVCVFSFLVFCRGIVLDVTSPRNDEIASLIYKRKYKVYLCTIRYTFAQILVDYKGSIYTLYIFIYRILHVSKFVQYKQYNRIP